MAVQHEEYLSPGHVVERGIGNILDSRRGRPARCACRFVLLLVVALLIFPLVGGMEAGAEEGQTDSGEGTVSEQITDTQNLLGSDVGSITDAIKSTKEETGVSVRLLYLPSFYQKMKPEDWAKQVLASMKPAPNTVLLAVASQDGKLVVAVSNNSDEWLRDQKTVDQLSQDALGPISKAGNPDWVGSAKALMDGISRIDAQRKQQRQVTIILVVLAVVVVLGVGAFLLIRKRRKKSGSVVEAKPDVDTGKKAANDAGKETVSKAGTERDGGTDTGTDTLDGMKSVDAGDSADARFAPRREGEDKTRPGAK